jgi:hypothetical protein
MQYVCAVTPFGWRGLSEMEFQINWLSVWIWRFNNLRRTESLSLSLSLTHTHTHKVTHHTVFQDYKYSKMFHLQKLLTTLCCKAKGLLIYLTAVKSNSAWLCLVDSSRVQPSVRFAACKSTRALLGAFRLVLQLLDSRMWGQCAEENI